MEIFYRPRFKRNYKKLPAELRELTKERIAIFKDNAFDPRLKTHKLKGHYKDFWSFSVNHSYRIIFEFSDKNTVHFHVIGDHDIYQ